MPSDHLAPHVDRGAQHRRAAIRQPSVECPSATVQPDVPCGVRLDRTRFGGTARARSSTIAVSPPAELGSVPYIAWKLRVIIVRTSGVNAYGGGGPPQRSIAPKMSPVRRKFPFAWGSKRYLALTWPLAQTRGRQDLISGSVHNILRHFPPGAPTCTTY